LGEYLRQRGYSRYFIEKFIIPMGAAVWSAAPDRFQEFPARGRTADHNLSHPEGLGDPDAGKEV
jgi:predicted NAD/FAD-binding protein